MNKQFLLTTFAIFSIMAICINYSCNKPKDPTITEQENMNDAMMMDTQIDNLHLYHDSTVYAHLHNPPHQHHYDSIFHHHDSIYNYHHQHYHHGEMAHHHTGWHHTPIQHYHHDSLIDAHHTIFH